MKYNRLNPLSMALTLALLSSSSIFIAGMSGYYFAHGLPIAGSYGSFYFGYKPLIAPIFLATGLASIGGFISGYILCWIYNLFIYKKWDIYLETKLITLWNKGRANQ